MAGRALAAAGRTVPLFARDQYVYRGPDSRSHVLIFNLSNVVNRVRVVATRDGARAGTRLLRLPPMGSTLLDIATLGPPVDRLIVERLRLTGNAWFNLYLVGAGARDLDGALSLMHVK
jgi:hypothetical protein